MMKKGLNSKFSLKDLPKYSQKLNAMKQVSEKQSSTRDPNKWEFLRNQCMLSQSDWYKSNLFQLYLKFGRGLLRDPKGIGAEDQVYTEVELRYYIEYLRQMTMKKYRDDITPAEMEHIL
jgi:hypothetical protein